MKFVYEEDEDIGFLDILLTDSDVKKLVDDDFCESSFRERVYLKKKINVCIRKEEDG
jgi:hypothetical protein